MFWVGVCLGVLAGAPCGLVLSCLLWASREERR